MCVENNSEETAGNYHRIITAIIIKEIAMHMRLLCFLLEGHPRQINYLGRQHTSHCEPSRPGYQYL